MADHVAAYFRHTLKVGLRLLADRGDTAMAHYVLSGPGTAALLAEPDANIVVAYVRRMEYDVPSILVVTLGSLLGTKTTPAPPSAKKAPKKQNDAYADYGGGEMIDEVYDNEDEWKGGGGKKGKKNKRASEASTNAVEVMEVEAEAEVEPEGAGEWAWVEAACKVHAALQKHPFVDYRQPATMASNFWNPVVELYPSIAEDYLSIIEQPMDMTTLYNTLVQLHFASPEAFVQAAVAIFQNAIMYNGGHSESDLAQRLVPRCELLVQYTRWMALDKLPLADTGTVEEAETEGGEGRTILTLSVHKAEARVREGLIKSAPLPLGLPPGKAQIAAILVKKECVRLLDAVRRSRNRAEKIEVSYFDLPVDVAQITDYSVYVRRPADFSTVRYRLEGVLPGDLRVRGLMDMGARPYKTVGDFLEEVRRIFSNAAKYNQPKRATDPVSDAVFLAAERLRERFETLLCTTSVTLAELQERRRILSTDSAKLELESLAVREREQARDRENYARLMEDKIRNDPSLARDRNTVQRIKESEAQAEAHRAAQQERSRSGAMEGPVGADDALRQGGSMEEQTYSAPQATETAYLGALGGPMVCGFGVGGTFPRKFAYQAQLKRRTLQRTRAEAVQRLEREQEERKRRAEKQKEQSVPRNRQREGGLDREQMGREQAQAQERQTVVGAFSLKGWRGRLKGANSVFTFVDDGSSH
ncbi:hypothetical protein B484DRAFT_50806 [Ochromonadaceae sp. CCMP2298]|nr:hypothetical protein B484DRAFT_50806 [Ochromonadaceae sp. CCMP2298]